MHRWPKLATDGMLSWSLSSSTAGRSFGDAASQEASAVILKPNSPNQELCLSLLQSRMPYVVVTGPAGTGKTAMACQEAVHGLKSERFKRLVITRPAVSADEDLGYLPGDAQGKLKPYMQPILDALERGFTTFEVMDMQKHGQIEIAALSFMRGRTLEDSFIIADEMQNATWEQIKLVLTRLGRGSKMIITGDPSQSDLRGRSTSGLAELVKRIDARLPEGLEYLRLVRLEEMDVVRHEAVAEVLSLFEG